MTRREKHTAAAHAARRATATRAMPVPTPLSSLFDSDLLLPHTALRGGDAPHPLRHAPSPTGYGQHHPSRTPVARGHAGAMSLWGEVTP